MNSIVLQAESYEDLEGNLAVMIREVVGPDVPIVGTFDLHGNISDECVAQYDFMCPVHLYPHTVSEPFPARPLHRVDSGFRA